MNATTRTETVERRNGDRRKRRRIIRNHDSILSRAYTAEEQVVLRLSNRSRNPSKDDSSNSNSNNNNNRAEEKDAEEHFVDRVTKWCDSVLHESEDESESGNEEPCSADSVHGLAEEVAMTSWLRAQRDDALAALHRAEIASSASSRVTDHVSVVSDGGGNTELSQTSQPSLSTEEGGEGSEQETDLIRLRHQLFDETIRSQQTNLLLQRIRLSVAALPTTFPQHAASSTDSENSSSSSSTSNDPCEEHHRFLRREAMRHRDHLVVQTLRRSRSVDSLRQELEMSQQTLQSVLQQNRRHWQQLLSSNQQQKKQQQQQQPTTSKSNGKQTGTSPPTDQQQQHTSGNDDDDDNDSNELLQRENIILRRALMDTISNCGIHWYANPRLRQVMMKLEQGNG